MAGIVRGIFSKVQAWQETTFGTTPGSPSTENMYYRQFGLAPSLEQLVDDTMSGGLRGQLKPIIGKKNVQGQVQTNMAPESCVKYLANLIGAPTITNLGTGKNQFVFAPGAGALAIPVGMGFEIDYGSNAPSPGRFLRLAGNRISKAAYSFKATGFAAANYDVIGSSYDWAQTTTIASPTDYGHTAFSMFVATLQDGGSPYASMSQVDLNWDNDLDDSLFAITGGGIRAALPEGMLKISGKATAFFDSMTLLNKALANTSDHLNLAFTNGSGDGTAGNESLVFDIPALCWKLDGVPISTPKGLMVNLQFNSFRAAGAEEGTTVTLKAARAAA